MATRASSRATEAQIALSSVTAATGRARTTTDSRATATPGAAAEHEDLGHVYNLAHTSIFITHHENSSYSKEPPNNPARTPVRAFVHAGSA